MSETGPIDKTIPQSAILAEAVPPSGTTQQGADGQVEQPQPHEYLEGVDTGTKQQTEREERTVEPVAWCRGQQQNSIPLVSAQAGGVSQFAPRPATTEPARNLPAQVGTAATASDKTNYARARLAQVRQMFMAQIARARGTTTDGRTPAAAAQQSMATEHLRAATHRQRSSQ
mmetsp:Transcript_10995/g.34608  ORF Transcript_10995/g.34608 Transcript_10995/m.34608 type:complete len:172 (-) Transcript_10995:882-1397(-)